MGQVVRTYFGPVDVVRLFREDGLALPEGISALPGQEITACIPADASVLIHTLKDFSESDIHFLIRFIEGMGALSGFPKVPAQSMDEFLDVIRELLALIAGLKDGFGVNDVQQVIKLLDRIYNLFH